MFACLGSHAYPVPNTAVRTLLRTPNRTRTPLPVLCHMRMAHAPQTDIRSFRESRNHCAHGFYFGFGSQPCRSPGHYSRDRPRCRNSVGAPARSATHRVQLAHRLRPRLARLYRSQSAPSGCGQCATSLPDIKAGVGTNACTRDTDCGQGRACSLRIGNRMFCESKWRFRSPRALNRTLARPTPVLVLEMILVPRA